MLYIVSCYKLFGCNHLLHFKNIKLSSNSFDIEARCGFMIKPPCENIRSTGADVAGMHHRFEKSGQIGRYSGSR